MLINFKNRASPTTLFKERNNFGENSTSQYKCTQQTYTDSIFMENDNINLKNDDVIVLEEHNEDCVYQVTIKKVYNKQFAIDDNNNDQIDKSKNMYQSIYSSNSNNNGNKDGLVYTRVKIKQLKYATLHKFIEHLTNQESGQLDSNLVQIFLATYRTFTDTSNALKVIKERVEKIVPASLEMTEDVRLEHIKSFRSIIYTWLEYYSEDFAEPPEFKNLKELNTFAQKHFSSTNNSVYSPEIFELIKSKLNNFEEDSKNFELKNSLFGINNRYEPPKQKSSHKRSCSNFVPLSSSFISNITDSNNSFKNFSTGNIIYMGSSSVHDFHGLSKSQTSLSCSYTKSQYPILNIFKKSNNSNDNLALNNIVEASFMSIDSEYFAQQLTYIDKCLFQKICAHLCLGGIWSTRYQKTKNEVKSGQSTSILSDKFATIGAFIDQFNIVSFIVQATILENTELKPSDRAKVIRKWIEIAQACRNLKNFSSLNAIVQGLNTQCVSRLEKTWSEVSLEYRSKFQELTDMFSEDQNQNIFRQILFKDLNCYAKIFEKDNNYINNVFNKTATNYDCSNFTSRVSLEKNVSDLSLDSQLNANLEGTAKYAEIDRGINATLGRKYKENHKKQMKNYEPYGTIPFLGTFLKDLEYINAQNPSKMEKGLINVMQKRKEFEIIAQIKLLQQAAQLYSIVPNPDFNIWLHKQTIYSEEQNYQLSRTIEPRNENDKTNLTIRSESVSSLNSKTSSTNSKNNQTHSRNNSGGIISDSTDGRSNKLSDNNSNSNSYEMKSFKAQSNLVVRVNIESNMNQNTVLYKTIYVKDSDRTKDVKRAILEKFLQNPDNCDKYTLVQVFNNSKTSEPNSINMQQKELIINDNCNVFYAAKSVPNMQFVLKYREVTNSWKANSSCSNTSLLNSAQNISSTNSLLSYGSSPNISRGNKSSKNLISESNKRSNIKNENFNDLPPQSPNHHQSKVNSWNKLFKKY